MSKATLSLLGLYQYDNTIFNELVLPEGMDKQLYINNLLMETAELEVLFSNPATMRSVIGIWSSAHLDSWKKMWNTTKLEYNPIENYNRQEDWTDNNKTNSKVQSTDTGKGKNHSTDISKAAGFDSGNLVTSGQNDNDSNNESTQIGIFRSHRKHCKTHRASTWQYRCNHLAEDDSGRAAGCRLEHVRVSD